MFRPMTRGCPYGSACSSPSPGFDNANKLDRYEKGRPSGTESYVCSMEELRTDVVSEKYMDEDNSDSFSELQGTILWPRRSYMYRVAFLSMMPAYGLFLFGFSCPFWMKLNQVAKHRGHYNQIDRVDVSIGLWRVCQGLDFIDLTDCTTIPKISSYTMACQAMLCLCLIFAFFSLVFGLYENCATRYETDEGGDGRTRRPEVNAVVAGVFGMIGVSLYGVIIIGVAKDGKGGVHWAFPLTACAVTGVTICGILMAISNRIRSQRTMTYAGQVIGMASQSSPLSMEIGMQDRLVSPPTSLATPSSSANGTVASNHASAMDTGPHSTPINVITRTESCLSSHMSSPDLFTSTAELEAVSLPQSNQHTHVVETHDLYTRPANPIKKQMLKRQVESKAAQRRSWHFDDKQGAYSVSDLMNNPQGTTLPTFETKRKDGVKPPVPPRRDKMQGPSPLQPVSSEGNDLMLLEDPVVTVPPCSSKPKLNAIEMSDSADLHSLKKRNTNPFLEDVDIYSGAATHSDNSCVDSSELWQNQPWPEPPTENEIRGDASTDNNPQDQGISYCHKRSASNSNDVPEILQYQPQNSGTLSRTQSTNSRRANNNHKTSDSPIVDLVGKGVGERRPGSRRGNRSLEQHKNKADAQVPVRKEYDNPMFNRQPSPHLDSRGKPSCPPPAYDSTSFITPAPLTSAPPPLYAAAIGRKDSFQSKQSQGHNTYNSNDSRTSGHYDTFNQNPNRVQSIQQQAQSNKNSNGHTQCSPKTKPKPPEKSRPRQVKREHNQRRTASGESPVPRTPPPGYYSSNPDISRQSPGASPRVSRRRPESMGRDDSQPTDDRNSYHHDHYNPNSARQSPYVASHPPWDSDL